MHIRDLEKNFTERFDQQDRAYRTLLTNSRKVSQDLRAVLLLDISTSQKRLSTQVAAAALDNVDVRKEVKELNAKVTYLDGQVAAIRNDLLNFHAKAEENHLNLSTLVVLTCSGSNISNIDWAVKMRIRPPEFETSICDTKYHVSLVGNIVMF
ncbi:hypothetical protein F511_23798 [Dorcoceras hygrometricum]|uniref:Uncharacterized protein n=1 Tax=Dorcoceras hygrometricum TaxID=472368 RepID=A0A2Z7B8Y4_9LAMI|nr:hypothetical protein F511_23798 [Dorcoceras hygrometricum]